jgi:hypothetical protein
VADVRSAPEPVPPPVAGPEAAGPEWAEWAELKGEVRLLAAQLHEIRRALESLRRGFAEQERRIGGGLDGAHAAVAALRKRLTGTEAVVRSLEETVPPLGERVTRMDEAVDLIRARLAADRAGLSRRDLQVHRRLAARLRVLLGERFAELTGARVRAERHPDPLRREAEIVRTMCEVFVRGGPGMRRELTALVTLEGEVTLTRHQEGLLDRAVREARSLRAAVAETGHEVEFDFTVPPGTPADPERHELWPSCRPGEVIDFVVTPAYRAGDRLLSLPGVLTLRGRQPSEA